MLPGSAGGEDHEGGLPKEDRDTLEEVARVPREEVRERPVEKAGWSDGRPVGPHPNQFYLNQLPVEPLSHLSQHILWMRRQWTSFRGSSGGCVPKSLLYGPAAPSGQTVVTVLFATGHMDEATQQAGRVPNVK